MWAAGICVVAVMVITTCMLTLIMLVIWKTRIWWILMFFTGFILIEGVYLSSVLYKFKQGGYLTLALAFVLMTIMGIWHYVHKEKYMYELQNKVSSDYIRELAAKPNINRVPGIGLLYSELVQGIPPIFTHFITNIPSTHSVVVFVSIKSLPISKVAPEERFLFRQVEPREYRMFRCVVRYGYKDTFQEPHEFERLLVENLKEFIRQEHFIREGEGGAVEHFTLLIKDGKVRGSAAVAEEPLQQSIVSPVSATSRHSFNASRVSSASIQSIKLGDNCAPTPAGAEEEMQFVHKAMEKGVVYLLGETEVVAKQQSSLFRKIIVNHAYGFLRKNSRQGGQIFAIPQAKLLRVGMTYEI